MSIFIFLAFLVARAYFTSYNKGGQTPISKFLPSVYSTPLLSVYLLYLWDEVLTLYQKGKLQSLFTICDLVVLVPGIGKSIRYFSAPGTDFTCVLCHFLTE